jgi:hypothetical protein
MGAVVEPVRSRVGAEAGTAAHGSRCEGDSPRDARGRRCRGGKVLIDVE